jgi:hypothetical protein
MASNVSGYIYVGASQFGTAAKQVYEVPIDVCSDIVRAVDPFYATRIDVVTQRRPVDLTEFVESAIPMTEADGETLEEPLRDRRIVTMKKRG